MTTTNTNRSDTRVLAVLVLLAAIAVAGCASSSHESSPLTKPSPSSTTTARVLPVSAVRVPTVSGPIVGGTPDVPMNAMPTALKKQFGYSEREYFFAGTASAYKPKGTLGQDGRWNVVPTTTAAYKSRMVVRTPTDPRKFNGTVVVEWLNETPGRDADFDFGFAHAELLRDGFAYVGVSAQALGVNGPSGLKVQNPTRYRGVAHPWRRLFLRHLLPGCTSVVASERAESAGHTAPATRHRDRRVTVIVPIGHLRECHRTDGEPLRRVHDPQPRERRDGRSTRHPRPRCRRSRTSAPICGARS